MMTHLPLLIVDHWPFIHLHNKIHHLYNLFTIYSPISPSLWCLISHPPFNSSAPRWSRASSDQRHQRSWTGYHWCQWPCRNLHREMASVADPVDTPMTWAGDLPTWKALVLAVFIHHNIRGGAKIWISQLLLLANDSLQLQKHSKASATRRPPITTTTPQFSSKNDCHGSSSICNLERGCSAKTSQIARWNW